MDNAQFWMFKTIEGNYKIKLVVRQLTGRNKHFFSIMSKKIKHPFRDVLFEA